MYGIYSDDDYAGADRNRPEWNRLLSDAQAGKFDVVVCKTQSRFTRELEMVEKYIHGLFPLWGIRFIGVVDNADTENKGNKKSRQINALVNEWYLEDMSESIKSALTSRRKQGYHIGSFALYGYKRDPDKGGGLIVDENAAAVVREVFAMYADGYGKTAIARALNDRSIPNPTEYKRLNNVRYKTPPHKLGTLWRYAAIADMLANEMYTGTMVQGRYGSVCYKTGKNKPRPKEEWIRVPGTHEGIIDGELWARVQTLLAHRAKPFGSGKIGLFSRKARCIHCGYTMRSAKSHGNFYLKCGTKHTAANACVGSFIRVDALERAVLNEIQQILDKHLDRDAFLQNISLSDDTDGRIAKLAARQAEYAKKLDEYAKAVRDTYLDKSRGVITEAQFVALSRGFAMDEERLRGLVSDMDEKIAALEQKRPINIERVAHTKPTRLERIMIDKLVHHISIGKRDKSTKEIPIEIHWAF